VFRERRYQSRGWEFVGFILVGLAGLALNEMLMKFFVETVGLGYALAKNPRHWRRLRVQLRRTAGAAVHGRPARLMSARGSEIASGHCDAAF
jgi:hypothetical protein